MLTLSNKILTHLKSVRLHNIAQQLISKDPEAVKYLWMMPNQFSIMMG